MSIRSLWFDRLRQKIKEAARTGEGILPGISSLDVFDLDRDLDAAELLLINQDTAERFIESGEAPKDLKMAFHIPFERVFFEFEPAVNLPGETGRLKGIFIVRKKRRYRVYAWFEGRVFFIYPRYDFSFSASSFVEGGKKRIVDLLCWLSGYISAANVRAIRHNRRPEIIRRHIQAGKPAPSSYYTFEAEPERKRRITRRRHGEPATRLTNVRGYFRRAHLHRLPSSPLKVWYPTTWVRSHKRRIPEPEREVALSEAA